MTAYQKNNYTAVISHSNNAGLSEKDSLLTGIFFLKTDQPSLAIHWLSPLTDHGRFSEEAAFYLSLSYLKDFKFIDAYSIMQQIHSDPLNAYHAQFPDEYLKKVKELER